MTDATEKPEKLEAVAESGEGKSPLFSPASIAGWLAIGSVLIIAISFVWEWGYWGFFGVSLVEIPMSIENLASVVFAWMPSFLLVAVIVLLMFFMWRFIDRHNQTKEQRKLAQCAVDPKYSQEEIDRMYAMHRVCDLFWSLLAISMSFILFIPEISGNFSNWNIAVFVAIFFLSYAFFKLGHIHYILWVIFCVIASIIIVVSMARIVASEDVSKMCASICIKDGTESQELQAIILRNNHDFIYAYNPVNKKILILPWTTVKRISYDAKIGTPIRIPPFSRNSAPE